MIVGLVAAVRDGNEGGLVRKAVEDGWVLCRVRISEVEEPQKGPNRVPSQSQPPSAGGD
jgi:hypothetical protein